MSTDPLARILVVDDEAAQMRALCDTLRDQGYETVGCSGGAEALAALRETRFDLILSDLTMPGMDGITLLAEAREVDRELMGIIMTGQGTIATAVEAMKAGAFDYILKPFKLSVILPVLSRALTVRQLRLENSALQEGLRQRTAALEAANSQLDDLYNNVPCGLHSVDENGLIVRMNDTWLAWLGCSREEIVGKVRHPELMTPQSAELFRSEWFPLFKRQGWLDDAEFEYVRKDGTTFFGLLSATTQYDQEGSFVASRSSVVDITERKRAEQIERHGQQRLRSILDSMFAFVGLFSHEGAVLDVNRAPFEASGARREDVIGKSLWETFFFSHSPEAQARVRRALLGAAQGEAVRTDISVRLAEHLIIDMDATFSLIRDGAGHATYVVGFAVDITERKRAAADLKTLNEQLEARVQERTAQLAESARAMRQLFDSLDATVDAVLVLDPHTLRFTYANQGAVRQLGYSREELLRMSPFDIDPNLSEAGFRKLLADLGASESRNLSLITVHRRKDGQGVLVEITVQLVSPAGEPPRYVAIARDITERKQIEQQLRQGQKMEAIGQLTGGIAHDFNNLLGVIVGNLDLLERSLAGSEPALKRVGIAQRAALRGADLTKRLLAFSRRQQLDTAPVFVAGCVTNVIEMARRTIGPDIEIGTRIAEDLPAVLADSGGLESALLNLFVNSRDAMPQGGTITVAARLAELDQQYAGVRAGELKAGRYMCIAVSDTGRGMAAETLQRAFEPFFTTKERGKGTGMGLAMVYGFAKQSGGHASIYSESGHGTTVKLYLPLAEPGAAASAAPKAAENHPPLTGTALVVDDEVDLLEIAVAYLEEMGFRVLHAMDGPRALEVLEREPAVDLLLTDIMMPGGMNGVELARRVREARRGIHVVYSTGFSSAALSEKNGMAADGPVLNKPYRRAEFFEAIRKAMLGRA
jgi:PAS domain S-box-containing protein